MTTFDHRHSHGLCSISVRPGNIARIHQHLRIGPPTSTPPHCLTSWGSIGYLDRDDGLIVSSVFAEDESADDASHYRLDRLTCAGSSSKE